MPVHVEVTYDMSKQLGTHRLELSGATVGEVVDAVRARFADDPALYEKLTAHTAVAVNGVLVRYGDRLQTKLADGDRLSFVKAAAGG
ncbi:MAG: MoaD/ThiS family protein [Deltaproteobacteria bacterium]|nr:MoaD/ThiS family protein [Deltaproteobacteria bacterium]MBW2397148.1 MoaD/ThiS family protein [Deltaproteobacteria bacterium]